jgi:hypothetical protein
VATYHFWGLGQMQLLDHRTEEAVSLLTKLAFGDVALVLSALDKYGDKNVDQVIQFIREKRDPSRRSSLRTVSPDPK